MSRIETHYELFILLGNTLTISMPFKMENGEITCTGMQSLRLSTSFGINNKQITIGYITDGKANSVDEDSICGFVDCFASREYVPDMDEMQRNCSCNVRKNLDGRIEYEVSHMNNQTLTPAIALQLFIKYLIIHEKGSLECFLLTSDDCIPCVLYRVNCSVFGVPLPVMSNDSASLC